MNFSQKKKVLDNITILIIFALIYLESISWVSHLEAQTIQTFILKTETLVYLFTFITFLSLLIIFHRPFFQNLKITKKDVWYVAIIFIFALIVRELIPPKTTRLFFDEDIYSDMAKQIAMHVSSCLCDYGNKFECFKCELMKWPVGHPFLLSIPFALLGSSNLVASHFMIFLSSLSVVFVFLSSYLLFEDKRIAIFSSLILALLPVHILWSVTRTADVTFSFFTSLILFFSILSAQSNNLRVHVISLLVLALAVQTKTEGIVLIPLYFLTQIILNNNYSTLFEKRSYVFMIIASLLLIFVYLVHTFHAAKTETWGSSGEKFSLQYLSYNLPSNLGYWFESYAITERGAYEGKQLYHPVIFTLIAIVGLVALFKGEKKKFLVLVSWLGILFIMYASFYAGSVYFGVDVRYVLSQYIPFSILTGFGLFTIFDFLRKKTNKTIAFVLLVALLLIYFSFYIPKMHIPPSSIQESYGARLYWESAVNFASKQPDNCYFISHVSSIYSWLGKGHVQIWYVSRPEFDKIVKENSCVIFDEGYWCAINVPESQSCVKFGKRYSLELLYRVNDTKENKVYSFYKIVPSFVNTTKT
jgi:hypothetical protein